MGDIAGVATYNGRSVDMSELIIADIAVNIAA